MENTHVINVADTQRPDETPEQFSDRLTRYASVAMGDVVPEVMRATAKHPNEFHSAHEGYAVLLEEVDELWDVVKLNPKKIDVPLHILDVTTDPKAEQVIMHLQMMRDEAIQVAAMAIRFIAELT
jgi:hypothetical protein